MTPAPPDPKSILAALALLVLTAACTPRSDSVTTAAPEPGTPPLAGFTDAPPPPASESLTQYVDPFIGSFPPGFVNPGPFAPFGMVQPGPDTEGPLNYGGYSVQNLLISGFSQIHMSAGAAKGGQFPLLPFTGELTPGDLSQIGWPNPVPAYASPFVPATQTAEVGYYRTQLLRYAVDVELAATERTAFHRYRYLGSDAPRLLLDVSRDLAGYHAATAQLDADQTLSGTVESSNGYTVYFVAQLNAPFSVATADGQALAAGVPVAGEDLKLLLDFPAGVGDALLVKVGLSFTDVEGARRNLAAENPGWDFDAVRAATRAKWEVELARVQVEGGSNDQRKSFYTALMRLQQFPNLHSDVDGRYRGPDGQVHQGVRPHYSQYSLWDSYRGQNQMLAEIQPTRYRDMVRSLLDFHRQAGQLPRWQQGPIDAGHMSGDPVIPFIGEAWCRGLLPESERPALLAAAQQLEAARRERLAAGYLPTHMPDTPLSVITDGPREAGTTLEFGIADFSLALMVASTGDRAESERLAAASLNYRNLQDPDSGFIRPRHEGGAWLQPFAPELGYGFQEGTSWQYSWLAMHDLSGLFAGMGGASMAQQRLDQFFALPANLLPGLWPLVQNQITLFGLAYYGNQYAPGNEHDLHAPYLYLYAGAPWKTQLVARSAAALFAPTPLGMPGNDDLGAMSGWLAWSLIGLYPMNPGTPLYVVGSPVFERVTLYRPGAPLVISAPGAGATAGYVNGLQLDGASLDQPWLLLPRAVASVGLQTSALPDLSWGVRTPPPSLSVDGLQAFGCRADAR